MREEGAPRLRSPSRVGRRNDDRRTVVQLVRGVRRRRCALSDSHRRGRGARHRERRTERRPSSAGSTRPAGGVWFLLDAQAGERSGWPRGRPTPSGIHRRRCRRSRSARPPPPHLRGVRRRPQRTCSSFRPGAGRRSGAFVGGEGRDLEFAAKPRTLDGNRLRGVWLAPGVRNPVEFGCRRHRRCRLGYGGLTLGEDRRAGAWAPDPGMILNETRTDWCGAAPPVPLLPSSQNWGARRAASTRSRRRATGQGDARHRPEAAGCGGGLRSVCGRGSIAALPRPAERSRPEPGRAEHRPGERVGHRPRTSAPCRSPTAAPDAVQVAPGAFGARRAITYRVTSTALLWTASTLGVLDHRGCRRGAGRARNNAPQWCATCRGASPSGPSPRSQPGGTVTVPGAPTAGSMADGDPCHPAVGEPTTPAWGRSRPHPPATSSISTTRASDHGGAGHHAASHRRRHPRCPDRCSRSSCT